MLITKEKKIELWGSPQLINMNHTTTLNTRPMLYVIDTSMNPVPNAQVCVYLIVHITKLQLQTTFPKPLYIRHSAYIHRDPSR
jgi:hypothetical protein